MSPQDDKCRIKIWDTAGQERYRNLTSSFFKDADGAIIVFDLTNHETFLNVKDWINGFYKMKGKELPMVIVGNKLDLCETNDSGEANVECDNQRAVNPDLARQLATDYGITYFETSAKADLGVRDLMDHIFAKTLEYKKKKLAEEDQSLPKPFPLKASRHSEIG